MKRLCWILLAVAACKKGGGAPAAEEEEATDPVAVTCAAARTQQVEATIVLRGVVDVPPERKAVVSAAVAGRVTDVRVKEGERVKAKQVVAVIEDPALDAAVAELDAAKPGLDAAVKNATTALARAKSLYDAGIKPRRDVDDAEAALAAAQAEVSAYKARRNLAVRQRDRARVTAPIAGVVVRVLRRVGELVDGSDATPILEIADPSTLELRADAPAADLVRVVDQAAVTIQLDALPGRGFPGTIDFVSPSIDPATALGVVRATLAPVTDAGIQLRPGLAGAISLPLTSRAAVVIAATAVRRGTAGTTEVVVCAAGVAEVREVEVGVPAGADVEITKGLVAGDRVVIEHVLALEDGVPIADEAKP